MADPQGDVKVSVVVPVYNAGALMQPCVDSLLGQTMTPGQLELVFVDDGSTDDSLARLRSLEATHDHVHVISIPNSGWPGKPRNVGTDAARGTYVMYVDQDDRVDPEAMARMYALGAANDADVVLGKVISDFRGVHHYLYRENVASCTIFDSRIMGSQTPHKMLRRAFLSEHEIRYPEGRRRLEDQLFITRAYFAASVVSVVSDYVCYRYLRRADGRNAGAERIHPPEYYANLREVLDVIDSGTEAGPVRDRFYRRFLKTEMLGRLSGRKLRNTPLDQRPVLLAEIRELMMERFPLSVDAGLACGMRLRAVLARRGDLAGLLTLDERMQHLAPAVRLTGTRWNGAAVELDVEIEFSFRDGPLLLEGSKQDWLLPTALTGFVGADERRLEPISETAGDVVIRHREMRDEWFLPSPLQPEIEPSRRGGRLRWRGTAVLEPASAAGGAPIRPAAHDLLGRVDAFGMNRSVKIQVSEGHTEVLPDLFGRPRGASRLELGTGGVLRVRAGLPARLVRRDLARKIIVTQDGDRLRVRVPADWATPRHLTLRTEGQPPTVVPLQRHKHDWCSSAETLRHVHSGPYQVGIKIKGLGGAVALTEELEIKQARGPVRLARGLRKVMRSAAARVLPK